MQRRDTTASSVDAEGCVDALTTASTTPRQPRRVLVIITGGTICMRPGMQEGSTMSLLAPAPLDEYLRSQPELQNECLPDFEIHEWETLVDSSDISQAHWRQLCMDIEQNYSNYDGFVILHGTDTLAYTASMLSFMLENLSKPVVVTGAVLPMTHLYSDAKRNVCVSLMIAGFSAIREVVVCFGSRILRGSRVSKVDCGSMDAFDSPNANPLGKVGFTLTVDEDQLRKPEPAPFKPFTDVAANSVFVLTITPGFNPSLLRHITSLEARPLGVVLELFGTGTAPTSNPSLISAIRFAVSSGVTLVAVTQCNKGTCSLVTYSNGSVLHDMGLIEGKDLTTEAAFAKLAYLFGKGYEGKELREMIEKDLRGDISEKVVQVSGQAGLRKWLPEPGSGASSKC